MGKYGLSNPYWPRQMLEDMLQKHLDLTTGEVVGNSKRTGRQTSAPMTKGIHMLMFADTLTEGIAKQFPDKFRATAAN